MNTDSIYVLMDAVIVACGVYILYLYVTMVRTRKLRQSVLMPQNVDIKKCKDVEGYIRYVGTKQLIFGIIAVVCGGLGLLQDFTKQLGGVAYLAVIAVFFVYAMWFGVQVKNATKRFW